MSTSASQISLTVDVEDYYHAANLSPVCPIKRWHFLPQRAVYSTNKTLDIFDAHGQKGTFFILASLARKYPEIVREIAKRGHEVASHGYAHKIAYFQNPIQFFRDIDRSKKILEDISGQLVTGYRAPNFSITNRNLYCYDLLKKAGFEYDSSLYPVSHKRYGNSHRSLEPEVRDTEHGPLRIYPLATYPLGKFRIPIAGGAYWRLFPEFVISSLIKNLKQKANYPLVFYFHPWELDYEQPYFKELPFLTRVRHYHGQRGFPEVIKSFLKENSSRVIKDFIPSSPTLLPEVEGR